VRDIYDVMVVDRRTEVRSAICEYLAAEGYFPVAAADYDAAIELLRLQATVRVALVDIDLRNEALDVARSGIWRLADEVAARGVQVIGMAQPEAVRDLDRRGYPVLRKPFHLREMLAYIRAVPLVS
jgi:DNA-binding response OmpR family regulator